MCLISILTCCCIGSITNASILSVCIAGHFYQVNLRSEDQRAFDPNVVHNGTAEVAADDHETEGQSITSVYEMGRLGTSSTERVHRTPDTWSREVAKTEDGDVEERAAVPFCCLCKLKDWST